MSSQQNSSEDTSAGGERDLYKDASALLQFSKQSGAPETRNVEYKEENADHQEENRHISNDTVRPNSGEAQKKSLVTSTASPPPSNIASTSNPGPAVAALSVVQNHLEGANKEHSMKAIVAAAALAAAASAPLPLPYMKEKVGANVEDDSNETSVERGDPLDDDKGKKKRAKPVKPEKAKTKPVSKKKEVPSYAVDPDAGTIDCICKVNEDDGFTIQCDKCFRWQHASCFNIMTNDVPDIYYCEKCDPKSFKAMNINIKRARERQLSLLRDDVAEKYRDLSLPSTPLEEPGSKRRLNSEADDSRRKRPTKERSTSSSNIDIKAENDEHSEGTVGKEDHDDDDNHKTPRKEKSRKKKKEDFDDNTNEELIHRIESAKDEYYYAVYYNLKQLEYRNRRIERYVNQYLPGLLNDALNNSANFDSSLNVLKYDPETLQQSLKRRPELYVKNILVGENNAPSPNIKFSGLSNLGVFTKRDCEKGQLLKEFFGEVDFQVNYFHNSINQFKFWGIPKNYYFFINFFQNDFTMKEVDEESSDSESPFDKDNLSNMAVALKRYLKQVTGAADGQELPVPLYINCKTSGNILRYVRKSCYPNCQIVPVLVDETVRFYLQAIKPVSKNSELTVGWEFNFNELYSKLYLDGNIDIDKHNDLVKSNFNTKLTNAEKVQLINQVEFVLNQYKCGCYSVNSNVNNIRCKLLRIKKMGSYFYRSSRKGSKLNKNDPDAKHIDSVDGQLIKTRLQNRDNVIQLSLSCPDSTPEPDKDESKKESSQKLESLSVESKEDPFVKRPRKKTIVQHPKRKHLATCTSPNYAILNSRAQLAKAIIANCLSIPVPVKSAVDLNVKDEISEKPDDVSRFTPDSNEDNTPKHIEEEKVRNVVKRENSGLEGKKVKKMSFADFLKNKSV